MLSHHVNLPRLKDYFEILGDALKDFNERIKPILSSTRILQDRIHDLTQQERLLREEVAYQEQLSQSRMTEIHSLRAKLAEQSGLRESDGYEIRKLREENRSLQKAREVVIRHLANEERKDAELAESREYGIKYKNKVGPSGPDTLFSEPMAFTLVVGDQN